MQYQKMIRQLLDEYVAHQKEMQSNKKLTSCLRKGQANSGFLFSIVTSSSYISHLRHAVTYPLAS